MLTKESSWCNLSKSSQATPQVCDADTVQMALRMLILSLYSVVGRGCVKLGVTKEWQVKYDIVGGLHTRSEEFGFLLHIGTREPLTIVE